MQFKIILLIIQQIKLAVLNYLNVLLVNALKLLGNAMVNPIAPMEVTKKIVQQHVQLLHVELENSNVKIGSVYALNGAAMDQVIVQMGLMN